MENSKVKILYSIIRYSPDEIRGEIINVGVLLYNFKEKNTKFYFLDESSQKIKAIVANKMELDTYKSYKDLLEFQLKESRDDASGVVGDTCINHYYDRNFLDKIYEEYKNDKFYLSKPNIAYTKNTDKFFKSILNRYIGEKI